MKNLIDMSMSDIMKYGLIVTLIVVLCITLINVTAKRFNTTREHGRQLGIKEVQVEAVKSGVAKWEITADGQAEFKWKERDRQKELIKICNRRCRDRIGGMRDVWMEAMVLDYGFITYSNNLMTGFSWRTNGVDEVNLWSYKQLIAGRPDLSLQLRSYNAEKIEARKFNERVSTE